MKAFIIDDEHANRETLQILLKKHFPEVEVLGESDNLDAFLSNKSVQSKIDLLFLDILMPNSTGFDLLRQLTNRNFEVILVTGFEEFALQAFDYSVIDYILKPIDKDRLGIAIAKTHKRFAEKHLLNKLKEEPGSSVKLSVIKNNKTIYIEPRDVAYMITQSGGYTTIYCKNGESHLITKSLSQFEKECVHIDFFLRVSQSTLINLQDIVSYDKGASGYIALKTNNFELFLSRRKKREVLNRLEEFLSQQN